MGIRDRAVADKVGDAHTGEIVKMRAQLDAIGGLAGLFWGKVESIGTLADQHVQKIQNSHIILYILLVWQVFGSTDACQARLIADGCI